MDSVDLEVLRRSVEWLDAGKRVLLVTVVRTWGSSPRPPGALLAVREDGQVVGSVSGGCIEDDIVERSRREGAYVTRPQAVTYGVSAEDARKFGLPCGGTIQLVLEPLRADSRIAELLAMVEQGQLVARTLDLDTASVRLAPARAADGLELRRSGADHRPRPALSDARSSAPGSCPSTSRRSPSVSTIRSPSATRARNTPKPGTSAASRWSGRCPTIRSST